MADTVYLPQAMALGLVQIANGDASNLKTALTAAAGGTKVTALQATSTDTLARDVQWGVSRGGTFYPRGTATIPINAGSIAATAGVDLLSAANCPGLPVDADGTPYVLLKSGDTLDIKSLTTVSSAKAISVSATGADF